MASIERLAMIHAVKKMDRRPEQRRTWAPGPLPRAGGVHSFSRQPMNPRASQREQPEPEWKLVRAAQTWSAPWKGYWTESWVLRGIA